MKIRWTHYSSSILLVTGLALGCSEDESATTCFLNTLTNESSNLTYVIHYNSKNQIVEVYNETLVAWEALFTYDSKGNLESSGYQFYSYDVNNRLIQIKSSSGQFIENYTYNEKNQMISATSISNDTGKPLTAYTYTYSNSTTLNFSAITYSYGATETFEYDNKPNPFKSIWPQLGAAHLLFWETPIYQTENNIAKSTYIEGTTTLERTYSYVFNERGYPISINVASHVITPTEESTQMADPYSLTYDCR